jgi:hypothetical protein
MKIKRLVAVLTAATMVLGCGITAFADSTATGTGKYEGDKPAAPTVSVTLPVLTGDAASTYNYIADPNDLIHITSGAAYGTPDSIEFNNDDNGYVYFKNSPDLYSNNSTSFKVESRNMADVNITMKAEVKTAAEGVSLADKVDFKDDKGVVSTDNLVFLGIVTSGSTTRATAKPVLDEEAAEVTVKVEGVEDNYEITYDSTGKKYQYSLIDDADALEWNSTELYLAGAINTAAEWEGVNTACPDITVTWSFAEYKDTIDAFVKMEKRGENNYLLMSPTNGTTFEGLTAVSGITSLQAKYKNGSFVDVKSLAIVNGGIIGLKYIDLKSPLGFETLTSGDKITVKAEVSGKTYQAVFTTP